MVKNNVKSLPKKKMDERETEKTLKTLIRYIIGDKETNGGHKHH